MIVYLFLIKIFFFNNQIEVKEYSTGNSIPFATYIGLNDQKGGYASEKGIINFTGDVDQLYIISCTGYLSDTVTLTSKIIYLKPLIKELPHVVVKPFKSLNRKIGFFKKYSGRSFAAKAKYEFYTFVDNPDSNVNWVINSLKLGVNGYSKKNYHSFKIRPHIYTKKKNLPHQELFNIDIVVNVLPGQKYVEINLKELIFLPKNGCFVGFEPIGFSLKEDTFIPFSDFSTLPNEDSPLISIPMVKAKSKSYWRVKNGKQWYCSPFESYHVFAFGLCISN